MIQTPHRRPNRFYRSREHLTPKEVHQLIDAAGESGRHRLRDRTLLLMMFRHGLRVGEACLLKWDAVMFDEAAIALLHLSPLQTVTRAETRVLSLHFCSNRNNSRSRKLFLT